MSYQAHDSYIPISLRRWQKAIVCIIVSCLLAPHCSLAGVFARTDSAIPAADLQADSTATDRPGSAATLPDSINLDLPDADKHLEVVQEAVTDRGDSLAVTSADTIPVIFSDNKITDYNQWVRRKVAFNPDPTRAVWMSALFPGLGQIYNRRFWKLPIVIGAYVGLGYGYSWNNSMLSDYTRAYRDIMDNDPSTKSYMDLFPSTTREEDLDRTWLTNVLRTRKDYYRRNRDLCIICMIGVYLIAMVDAYVDASLSHFDISPDLAVDFAPAVMQDTRSARPALGMSWAITF